LNFLAFVLIIEILLSAKNNFFSIIILIASHILPPLGLCCERRWPHSLLHWLRPYLWIWNSVSREIINIQTNCIWNFVYTSTITHTARTRNFEIIRKCSAKAQNVLKGKKTSLIWYMIYLLTAIGLTPGGSCTAHIYTQTIHRTTQNKQDIEQHKNFENNTKSLE
jgi:hypothetical protein